MSGVCNLTPYSWIWAIWATHVCSPQRSCLVGLPSESVCRSQRGCFTTEHVLHLPSKNDGPLATTAGDLKASKNTIRDYIHISRRFFSPSTWHFPLLIIHHFPIEKMLPLCLSPHFHIPLFDAHHCTATG